MGDVRIKITPEGLKIWRTTKAASGSTMRVSGTQVELTGRHEVVASLKPFQKVGLEPPKVWS